MLTLGFRPSAAHLNIRVGEESTPAKYFYHYFIFPHRLLLACERQTAYTPFHHLFPFPTASKTVTLSMSGIKDKLSVAASELNQVVQLSEYRTVDQINTSFRNCARHQQTTAAMLLQYRSPSPISVKSSNKPLQFSRQPLNKQLVTSKLEVLVYPIQVTRTSN